MLLVHDLIEHRGLADEMLNQMEAVIKEQFEQGDDNKTGDRHIKGLVVEQGHTEQHQGKEDELHPDAEEGRHIGIDGPSAA